MKSAGGPDRGTVQLRFFAFGLYLTLVATPAAHGQVPDTFYDSAAADDRARAHSMLQEGLETHRSQEIAQWRSNTTGNSGTITPLRTFRIETGFFCRDFRETLVTAVSLAERVGTACRRKDGVWSRVER